MAKQTPGALFDSYVYDLIPDGMGNMIANHTFVDKRGIFIPDDIQTDKDLIQYFKTQGLIKKTANDDDFTISGDDLVIYVDRCGVPEFELVKTGNYILATD